MEENKVINPEHKSPHNGSSSVSLLHSKIPVFHVECQNSTIQAGVLCYWDNIYGPKVRNMWMLGERKRKQMEEKGSSVDDIATDDNDDFKMNEDNSSDGDKLSWEGLNMICRQALCSEIMKDPTKQHLDSKLVHCPSKRLLMLGMSFGALSQYDISMHSLVVVASYAKAEMFLQWKDVVDAWLLRCVLQLRVSLAINATNGYTLVREGLKELVRLMDHSPSLSSLPTPSNLWSTEDALAPGLLHCSVVGHLCMAHHSIVIGTNHALVNKMVHRLSQLSLPQHQHRHHPLTFPHQPYSPELHIQGLHKSDETLASIGELCGFSDMPSCLIDVDTGEVSLQDSLEQYEHTHRSFLTHKLLQLWNACPASPALLKDIFKQIRVKDSMVLAYLNDMQILPGHVTNSMARHVMKMLHRKVLVLMQCLTCKLNKRNTASKSSSKPPASSSGTSAESYEALVKEVRGEMGLTEDWDWCMVLGCAEAMHPGLIHSLKTFPTRS